MTVMIPPRILRTERWDHDAEMWKKRQMIENFFARIKAQGRMGRGSDDRRQPRGDPVSLADDGPHGINVNKAGTCSDWTQIGAASSGWKIRWIMVARVGDYGHTWRVVEVGHPLLRHP